MIAKSTPVWNQQSGWGQRRKTTKNVVLAILLSTDTAREKSSFIVSNLSNLRCQAVQAILITAVSAGIFVSAERILQIKLDWSSKGGKHKAVFKLFSFPNDRLSFYLMYTEAPQSRG